MAKLIITGKKNKLNYLKNHLEKEHPSTKGKNQFGKGAYYHFNNRNLIVYIGCNPCKNVRVLI